MAEKSRRKLIKGLGISIPTAWAAPIIEAVILPVHAATSCEAQDDEFAPEQQRNSGSVAAPGVLENDSCTEVVSNTDAVVIEGEGPVNSLNVNPDGSFNYSVEHPAKFTFTYTTEGGTTATVTVDHLD